jgi:hypothetical protein
MNRSRRAASRFLRLGCLVVFAAAAFTTEAAVELSTDWSRKHLPNGGGIVPNDPNEIASEKLDRAIASSAIQRSAALDFADDTERDFDPELALKLKLDGKPHYLAPVLFMSKSRPDELCSPTPFKNTPTYMCDEGQRHTQDCHLFIFNDKFEEVGYHRIAVRETFPFFCNTVLAVGVGNKDANELLVTVQYFSIDRKPASKTADIGQGWRRMTVALRLRSTSEGKVLIEQQDACLKNPNGIESIPDARQALRHCLGNKP